MDMEYTFHLPKIIVSLNKLTWSGKASSHKIILPQQTIILFLWYPCAWSCELWLVVMLVMVSGWAEYQMSTRGEVSVVGTQGCILNPASFDEDIGLDIFHFSQVTLHLPSYSIPYKGLASLGCINSSLFLWLLVWVWPMESSPGGSSFSHSVDSRTCPNSFSVDRLLNVGCLTTLNTHFGGIKSANDIWMGSLIWSLRDSGLPAGLHVWPYQLVPSRTCLTAQVSGSWALQQAMVHSILACFKATAICSKQHRAPLQEQLLNLIYGVWGYQKNCSQYSNI